MDGWDKNQIRNSTVTNENGEFFADYLKIRAKRLYIIGAKQDELSPSTQSYGSSTCSSYNFKVRILPLISLFIPTRRCQHRPLLHLQRLSTGIRVRGWSLSSHFTPTFLEISLQGMSTLAFRTEVCLPPDPCISCLPKLTEVVSLISIVASQMPI
jgi:hypothetical protein